ncbi:MAG: molybdenum cofactor guanylyltransferase [bacterium]
MTGVILAGGENRRFPYSKSFIIADGTPIIERTLRVLGRVVPHLIISTNDPAPFFKYRAHLVGDVLPERGPLTGIVSAMIASPSEWFLVTACDMPCILPELVDFLLTRERNADALVPVYEGKPQPLLGLYHRRLIQPFYAKMTKGYKKMSLVLDEINAQLIDERQIREIDPQGKSFVNINTPDELDAIRKGGMKCSD